MLDVDRPGFAVPVAFPVRAFPVRTVPVRAVAERAVAERAVPVRAVPLRAGAALRTDDDGTPPPAV